MKVILFACFLIAATATPTCMCENQWTDSVCSEVQSGCPSVACDGDLKSWCSVSNPGCAEDEEWFNNDPDGDHWAYCNESTPVQAACECKNQWTNICSEVQSGCPSVACDGNLKSWCSVSNPGCVEDEGNWAYCTADIIDDNTTTAPIALGNSTDSSSAAPGNSTDSSSAAPDESSSAAPGNSTDSSSAAPGNSTDSSSTAPGTTVPESSSSAAPGNSTDSSSAAPSNDSSVAPIAAGSDLKVEIVSSIGFAAALNDTMQATVKDAFCADVKSTLADISVTTVVLTCTIAVTPATRRRLLAATSYDLKAEATVPAASGLTTKVNAGLAGAIAILDKKLLANPTMAAANGNVALTVTTTQTTVSVPASASSTAAPDDNKVLDSGTGRACMVPSAIVFVLASSLFN